MTYANSAYRVKLKEIVIIATLALVMSSQNNERKMFRECLQE